MLNNHFLVRVGVVMVVFGGYDGMDNQFTGQGGPGGLYGWSRWPMAMMARFFSWSVLLPLKF